MEESDHTSPPHLPGTLDELCLLCPKQPFAQDETSIQTN